MTFRSKYRAADIEPKNSIVPGGLFRISKSDEKLDVYEDYPILYKKHFFILWEKVMTYTMVKPI